MLLPSPGRGNFIAYLWVTNTTGKWIRLVTSEALNSVCRRFESDTLGTMIIFNTSTELIGQAKAIYPVANEEICTHRAHGIGSRNHIPELLRRTHMC